MENTILYFQLQMYCNKRTCHCEGMMQKSIAIFIALCCRIEDYVRNPSLEPRNKEYIQRIVLKSSKYVSTKQLFSEFLEI